jgi:hypothetical protein
MPFEFLTVALLIPIAAIVCGSIKGIVKIVIQHRERMAKIGMGIDPDASSESPAIGFDEAGARRLAETTGYAKANATT